MTKIDISRRSANKWSGRPQSIRSITIHHWGVNGQKHDNVVNYLCRKNGNTSAHYVVSAGRISEIVAPGDRAWHSGNTTGNNTSIGIECRPEMSAGDMETTGELIAFLRKRYGNLPLLRHSDWRNTECPGKWRTQLGKLDEIAGKYMRGAAGTAPTVSEPKPTLPPVAPIPGIPNIDEKDLKDMITHILFTYGGHWYCAAVLAGKYWHIKDEGALAGVKRVIEVAGGKWIHWGERDGGGKSDGVGEPWVFGEQVPASAYPVPLL